MQTERGCRNGIISRSTNDDHTVLRSMAIKDFAPDTKLYVQVLRRFFTKDIINHLVFINWNVLSELPAH